MKTGLDRNEIYKILYELSQDAYIITENGKVIEASPYALKMLGFPRDKVYGSNVLSFVPDYHKEDVKKRMHSKKTVNYKTCLINSSGDEIPVRVNAKNVQLDGRVVRVAHIYDLRTEEKLEYSEELYKNIFDATGTAILIFDKDRNIVSANDEFFKMVGYEKNQVIGDRWENYVHDDSKSNMLKYNKLRMQGSELAPSSYEFKLLGNKKTEVYSCRIFIRLLENRDIGIASIVDLSETKKLEDELFKFNNKLEDRIEKEIKERIKSQKHTLELEREREKQYTMLMQQSKLASMGEMIGNIAHQWRQPLNSLGLMLFNLYSDFEDGDLTKEQMYKAYDSMRAQIDEMSKTIDDFRYFYKPSKSKKSFCLLDAITNSLNILNAQLHNHRILIDVEVDRDIEIFGFESELSQVFINIINNAKDEILKKSSKGKIKINGYIDEKESVIIDIEDNGGGVSEEYLDKLFEPYFTTKKEGEGTGIGLYMCKMIVEKNMNGELSVKNIDDGARFRIKFFKDEIC
jgi:PAS domain S-box-containing protein